MNTYDLIYCAVKQIPRGQVASYSQIAALAGNRRWVRVVGYALNCCPASSDIPCHRVVMKDGSLSKGFAFGGEEVQRALLEKEGVGFDGQGKVKKEFFIDFMDENRLISHYKCL